MKTYRDLSFCSDGPACVSKDCARRFTPADHTKARALGLPVAWMSRRDTCSHFVAIKPKAAA